MIYTLHIFLVKIFNPSIFRRLSGVTWLVGTEGDEDGAEGAGVLAHRDRRHQHLPPPQPPPHTGSRRRAAAPAAGK